MKFDPYNPPRFWGEEPQEYVIRFDKIADFTDNYSDINIPEGATHIYVEAGSDYSGGTQVLIRFQKAIKVRNRKYKTQLAEYLKNSDKFKQDFLEWQKQKVVWDAEQLEQDKKKRKEQFIKLKKEFESEE